MRWLLLLGVLLSGCATYSDRQADYRQTWQSNPQALSPERLAQTVSPDGSERILYWLELGSIYQQQGNWQASAEAFQRGDDLTRAWLRLSSSEQLKQLLSSQDAAIYQPTLDERWLLHWRQLLNYFALAQSGGGQQALSALRVEARRLDLLLAGGGPEYTAFFHWWIGIAYERLQEWDNARVSYQKAAQSAQFNSALAAQAQADMARMLKLLGDPLPPLAPPYDQQVAEWQPSDTQHLNVIYDSLRPAIEEVGLTLVRLGEEVVLSARSSDGATLLSGLYGESSLTIALPDWFDVSVLNFSVAYIPEYATGVSGVNYSPAQVAHQRYQQEFLQAVLATAARELAKAAAVGWLDQQIDESSSLALLPTLLTLYNASVATADTRYWLSSPALIRVERGFSRPDVQQRAGQIRLYLSTKTTN